MIQGSVAQGHDAITASLQAQPGRLAMTLREAPQPLLLPPPQPSLHILMPPNPPSDQQEAHSPFPTLRLPPPLQNGHDPAGTVLSRTSA